MTETDLAQLKAVLREELRAILPEIKINGVPYTVNEVHHILTRAEARQYVRRTSDAAFSAWCARWQVRAECRGRWSRARLDLALAREAGTAHVPANLRK